MTKRINMFDALKEANAEKKSGAVGLAAIIAAVLALNLLVFAALFVPTQIKKTSVSELNEFMSSSEAVAVEDDYYAAESELSALQSDLGALSAFSLYYGMERSFTSELYGDIMACKPDNATVRSFVFTSGMVRVECTTPDNMPPADFTKALQDSKMFSSVKYSGFSTDTYGNVVFPIVCSLNIWG